VTGKNEGQSEVKWFKRFLAMFFAGFVMTLLGVVFLVAASVLSGTEVANVGGIIGVFPFLIVFGAGPEAYWLILVAVLLAILGVLMLFVVWKTRRKGCF